MINDGDLEEAISTLLDSINSEKGEPNGAPKSELYYLLGNAYRKKGDFHLALNNYTLSVEADPESPAAEARESLLAIMQFYNKDMYNQ
jgi:tetratricopeptide (TPR) repeat protein